MAMKSSALIAAAILSFSGVVQAAQLIDVYKSPSCGCCGKWIEHLKKAGFKVETHEVTNIPGTRKQLGMPDKYGSCHTAKAGGYVVEGHVPAADIQRLLAEKPKVIGLAVPSMPPGSPGMDIPNSPPYETLLIQTDGSSRVFAKH